jgi:hypothetical protein
MFEASQFTDTRRRDTAREDKALTWLRRQPEAARFEFASQLVQNRYAGALEFVRRSDLSGESLVGLFRSGLDVADASNIHSWIEAVIGRLGTRKVLTLLRERVATDRLVVEKAVYWLPKFIDAADGESREVYENLKRDCEKNG